MRIDGNKLADQQKKELRIQNPRQTKPAGWQGTGRQELGLKPNLLIVLMDKDEDSVKYAEMKKKIGEEMGIEVEVRSRIVHKSRSRIGWDGIVVQRPKKVNKKLWKELVNQIPLEKDVDGLRKDSKWEAPAVKVVKKIINSRDFQNVVVIGKGPTVGGPIIRFLKRTSGIDLKVCDSKTSEEELKKAVGEADLVITGTGVAGLIKAEWLKSGAGVIDFGWGRPEVEGDLEEKTSFYTPVPGGVGPMIVMALMENVIKSCLWQKK